jgi:hypothetical protein
LQIVGDAVFCWGLVRGEFAELVECDLGRKREVVPFSDDGLLALAA